MKIVVCDDDELYANEIKYNVMSMMNDRSVSSDCLLFFDSRELFEQENYFDMAFLDIEMKPYAGIEIAKKLQKNNQNIIVFFITSYEQYLDEAMDLDAFRYINKPLDDKRLKAGIDKALDLIDNRVIKFLLKKDSIETAVSLSDIIYLETVGAKTKIVTVQNEFISSHNMDYFEKKLIPTFFYRVHKSYIINIRYVTDYTRNLLVLSEKYNITVSHKYQTDFRRFFFKYFGGR